MSKTTAPLLSFGATGQLARTAVYASWKGIPYVRRYTVPANPRTTRQMVTRLIFKNLQRMYLLAPAGLKAPFEANAQGRPYTANNKFTSLNVKGIDTSAPPTDWSFFQGSPGARGGLPPTSLVLTGGANQISAAVGTPQVPSDWSIDAVEGVLFMDQDPQADFEGQIVFQDDNSSPYTIDFTGLEAATDYVVSAWIKWVRPDGSFAYSTSLTDIETTDP